MRFGRGTGRGLSHPAAAPSRDEGLLRKPKLLLVDDEHEILELLEAAFADCETRAVQSADEALQALSSGTFDALITDIKLPGASGSHLISEANQRWPELPIIVITGHYQAAPESEKTLVCSWLLKPFRRKVIRSAVMDALALSELHQPPERSF